MGQCHNTSATQIQELETSSKLTQIIDSSRGASVHGGNTKWGNTTSREGGLRVLPDFRSGEKLLILASCDIGITY